MTANKNEYRNKMIDAFTKCSDALVESLLNYYMKTPINTYILRMMLQLIFLISKYRSIKKNSEDLLKYNRLCIIVKVDVMYVHHSILAHYSNDRGLIFSHRCLVLPKFFPQRKNGFCKRY